MVSGTIHTNYGDKKLSVDTWDIKFSGWQTTGLLSFPSAFYLLEHPDLNEHSAPRLHYCFTHLQWQLL